MSSQSTSAVTPFHLPAFRWLWCSSVAAAVALGVERTATAWLALSSTDPSNGAVAVGLVLAARTLPSLLFGLAAGTIADRVDRTRVITLVGATWLLIGLALAWLVSTTAVQVWQVMLISFGAGCVQVFDTPARQALTVDVVPRAVAPNAVSLNAVALRSSVALGSFVAGALIASTGVASCYAAIALSFGLATVLISRVRVLRGSASSTTHPGSGLSFASSLKEAARLIVDNPRVRTLTIASIACEVFGFSFMSAVPMVARDVLHAGPTGFGVLNAAAGLGGSVSVIALAIFAGRLRLEPVLALVFGLYGASLLALAGAREIGVAAAALLVTGACASTFDVLQQTLMQLAVPESQRGRAVGVWMFGIGSAPLGHLEMGTLAASFGAPGALLLNGSLVLLGAATLLYASPSFRWLPGAPRPTAE